MTSYINTNIKFNIDFKSDKIKVLLGIFLGIYVFFLTFCIYKRLYLTEHLVHRLPSQYKYSNYTDNFNFEFNKTKHIHEIKHILVNLKKYNNDRVINQIPNFNRSSLSDIYNDILYHYREIGDNSVNKDLHNHINKILKNIKETLNDKLLEDFHLNHHNYRGKHINKDKHIDIKEFYKLLKYNITKQYIINNNSKYNTHNTLKNTKYIKVTFKIFNISSGNTYTIQSGFIIFDDISFNNKIDDYKYIIIDEFGASINNVNDILNKDEIINYNFNWLSQDRYYKHLKEYDMMDLSESQYEEDKTDKNIMLDFDYLDYKCNKKNEYDMRRKIDYEGQKKNKGVPK